MSVRCQSSHGGSSTWFVSDVFSIPSAVSKLKRAVLPQSVPSIQKPTRLTEFALSTKVW